MDAGDHPNKSKAIPNNVDRVNFIETLMAEATQN